VRSANHRSGATLPQVHVCSVMGCLKILRPQAGSPSNSRQHHGPDLLPVVERERVWLPPIAFEPSMRALLLRHGPADAKERGEYPPGLCRPPARHRSRRWGNELDLHERLRIATTSLHVGCKNSERDGLHVRERFLAGPAVRKHAGQVGDLRNPAAVHLAIELDHQLHTPSLARSPVRCDDALRARRRIRLSVAAVVARHDCPVFARVSLNVLRAGLELEGNARVATPNRSARNTTAVRVLLFNPTPAPTGPPRPLCYRGGLRGEPR
jgi:hypothetical protein